MTEPPAPVRDAQAQAETVSRTRTFELFARAGLIARGAVYGIIGLLALKLALGDAGGRTTSQQGALKEIARQPFGKWLLVATAIGLAGYACWRFVRAAIGHGAETGEDSTVERFAGVVSGIGYALLCATAVGILVGSDSTSGSNSQTTGGVLGWTGGVWIVGIAGLFVVGEGLYQGYKGLSRKFVEDSKTEEMDPDVERAFTALGIFGHLARAVVFSLIGYFLLKAAIDYNPDKPVSIDAALGKLTQATYGPLLLGIVSCGLIGFALYCFIDARYRRV